MRRIAALVTDGTLTLEEIHWDDTADIIVENAPADDIEAVILDAVPGEIARIEDRSPDGSGIYYVEAS